MDESSRLERNLKIYPIYKMFSWDLLFYYAIIFLFLLRAKGLTASQIFFTDAFYPIFRLFFQFACVRFSDFFGKRKSILVGNLFINSGILLIILCKSMKGLIFANLLFAIGYNLKELCEAAFLNASITNKDKRREIFARIDGNSSSLFYILDAVAAASTGFLFTFSYYLPIIICLVFSIAGTLISIMFENTTSNTASKRTVTPIKDLRYIFRHIFNSKRLRSLILYSALFSSFLAIFKTYMNSLLVDLNLPDIYFGFLTALIQVVASISSKNQNRFQTRYKNRTLTVFAVPISIFTIITGLTVICGLPRFFIYTSTAIMIGLYAVVKGPYYTLIKKYLNSFVSSSVTTKIYAANSECDSIFRSMAYLLSSYLLGITTTSFALVVMGSVFTLIFIILLEYMRTRVGLNPEEYTASDTQIGIDS